VTCEKLGICTNKKTHTLVWVHRTYNNKITKPNIILSFTDFYAGKID